MKKSDIKTGMLVQTRNGDWHVAMIDTSPAWYGETSFFVDMSDGDYLGINDYSDTLLRLDKKYDVVKVAATDCPWHVFRVFRNGDEPEQIYGFKIIWERQEEDPKAKQLKELCSKLKDQLKAAEEELQAITAE